MLFTLCKTFSIKERETETYCKLNMVLFKNPRDKLQFLTLAKQMYPGETAWFKKQYEEAVRRPFGYLFVDLKPTTKDSCRLRRNEAEISAKFIAVFIAAFTEIYRYF